MALRTSVKAARTALGTAALSAALRVSDLTAPDSKDVVTEKWVQDPNGSGNSLLSSNLETVTTPGMPFDQAVASASPHVLRDTAVVTGAYLAAKGMQRLNRNLSPKVNWLGKKKR